MRQMGKTPDETRWNGKITVKWEGRTVVANIWCVSAGNQSRPISNANSASQLKVD